MPEILSQIKELSNYVVMGFTLGQLLGALSMILLGFIAKRISTALMARARRAAKLSRTRLDDILVDSLEAPLGWGLAILGVYLAVTILPLPKEPVDIGTFVTAFFRGVSVLIVAWFAVRLSDALCRIWEKKAEESTSRIEEQAIPIIRRSLKVFISLVAGSIFLQNLGYSVTSLLAGLGLGGAAIALASKDTLSNLFGAVVIFFDRPFHVGDWIEVGGSEGTVEEIGLRTTRIRTFANSVITLPNASLTTTPINNWSQMKKRRIMMSIGVTYGTSADRVQEAVEAVREIIREDERIHKDFFLVNFDKFGASSLEIFIYCFTVTTNWGEFLEAKQQFMLAIMRRFQELGLSFAFPTQTIHIESFPGQPPSMLSERPQ